MRLLVDIGNTRLKWTWLDNGLCGPQHALLYRQNEISEQLSKEWAGLALPQSVHIVSVSNRQLTDNLAAWLVKKWGCPVEVLQTGLQCGGVINGYIRPDCLGVDRWAAMVAAYNLINAAVCVIDCGTALTCDALDSRGRHLGGVIAPGLTMMRDALLERTAGIEVSEPSQVETLWGRDTTSCVIAGGVTAALGLIERVVLQLQQELDEPVMAMLTGGDAESLLPRLAVNYRYEPSLVLQGVAHMVLEQMD